MTARRWNGPVQEPLPLKGGRIGPATVNAGFNAAGQAGIYERERRCHICGATVHDGCLASDGDAADCPRPAVLR